MTKIKSSFSGREYGIPKSLCQTFLLNDRTESAVLTLDCLGNYSLDTPYGISDATARRSVFYKPTIGELTRQMIDAYNEASNSFTQIVDKCSKIETDILYKKRLAELVPQKYSKKHYPEPQPSKIEIQRELQEEADQKFYRLFSKNTSKKNDYVNSNLSSVYTERLKRWETLVTFFDYIETIVEAKKNKAFYEEYNIEKSRLENYLYGPDAFFKLRLKDLQKDENIPLRYLPFELDYRQKEGIVSISLDMPSKFALPQDTAQFYASGKLWVKNKQTRDYASDRLAFYLGLAFFIASKLFNISLNIQTIRISIVESSTSTGLVWIEFEREKLRQTLISECFDLLSESLRFRHVFEQDTLSGLKHIPLSHFNEEIETVINSSTGSSRAQTPHDKNNQFTISFDDARLLTANIANNSLLKEAIDTAYRTHASSVLINRSLFSILQEIKNSIPQHFNLDNGERAILIDGGFKQIDYSECTIEEYIDEDESTFEFKMKSFLEKVISVEAPISKDILNRRICSSMKISRVSARLSNKIATIIQKIDIFTTTEVKQFYWSNSIRPGSFEFYRRGGNRDALDITADEVANCIAYNIDCTGETDRDDVLRNAANDFGFTRMGINVQSAMESGVRRGVERGILIDQGLTIVSTI